MTATVNAAPVSTAEHKLTAPSHPVQRCGAWAVAVLAGRESPEAVTQDDLDTAAERLTSDVVRAATAPKDGSGYDWWKVLFALYPNAKPTHALRSHDPDVLRPGVAAMFAPDPPTGAFRPCTFCSQPSPVLWAKSTLPMFDTTKAVNSLPPRTAGWPVCRACRVAVWALPYGAWLTAGSATVMTCDNAAVMRSFTRRNADRASKIQQLGFDGLPANAAAETITLAALRANAADAPAGATLWMFKNDNQDPWLRVTATSGGTPTFLRRMYAEPDCRWGWGALQAALTRRDKEGRVTTSGAAEAAKTLFEPEGQPPGRLLRTLRNLTDDPGRVTARKVTAWRALCHLYLKEICGMDTDQLSRLKPVRELLADWITQEPNPRGRFNEYRQVAGKPYELQKLLMTASARLYLDGRQPAVINGVTPDLLVGQDGWRLRGQLFFDVIAELVARDAKTGLKSEDEPEDDAEVGFDETDHRIEEGA